MNSSSLRGWILFAALMRKCEKLLLAAFAVVFVLPVCAQNGTLSPYSRFGIGQLGEQSTGISKAMGGVGIGLRQKNIINTLNPASYSTVDTLTFLFDMGISLTNSNFDENGIKQNERNSSFDYVAMQFRLGRKLGFTASMLPLSNVGYNFSETATVRSDQDGDVTTISTYGGEGGIRQISIGLGWAPYGWLSVGADAGYLFGDVTHLVSNKYSESTVFTRNRSYYAQVRGFRYNLGLQTTFRAVGGEMTFGVVYTPAVTTYGESYVLNQLLSGSGTREELSDTTMMKNDFRIPDRIGAGLTYSREKWTAGFDVTYERWSDGRAFDEAGEDRLKLSLGGMFTPEKNDRHLFRRSSYRAGLFCNQPYFNVGADKGPLEIGASVGVSMPIANRWNNLIAINVSGQYVYEKPSVSGMISETYLRLNLGISFNERWFMKWRVE